MVWEARGEHAQRKKLTPSAMFFFPAFSLFSLPLARADRGDRNAGQIDSHNPGSSLFFLLFASQRAQSLNKVADEWRTEGKWSGGADILAFCVF
jgi:hypothetical protein